MSAGSTPDPTTRIQLLAELTSDTAIDDAIFMPSSFMFVLTVATRGGWRCPGTHSIGQPAQWCQGRVAAMLVDPPAAGPVRSGPSSVSPGREAASGVLSRRRCCATRNSLFIRSRRCACDSPSSPRLPASIADAFGDCLIRSAPKASRHQRRHDRQEGHNDPVRNGVDSERERRKAHKNRPSHEELRLVVFGEHETSVGNADRAPLFRIARCAAWRSLGV